MHIICAAWASCVYLSLVNFWGLQFFLVSSFSLRKRPMGRLRRQKRSKWTSRGLLRAIWRPGPRIAQNEPLEASWERFGDQAPELLKMSFQRWKNKFLDFLTIYHHILSYRTMSYHMISHRMILYDITWYDTIIRYHIIYMCRFIRFRVDHFRPNLKVWNEGSLKRFAHF